MKTLFLCLFLASTSLSFTPKDSSNHIYIDDNKCGPWIYVDNNLQSLFDVDLSNGYNEDVFYDLPSYTKTFLGQWSAGTGTFVVKLDIVSPQTGSIKVYQGGTLIKCVPTNSSDYRYDFDFNVTGCLTYTILVSTDSC